MNKVVKDKTCRECKDKFTPYNTTQTVCSPKCAIENARKKLEKKEKDEWSKRKKSMSDKLETRTQKINKVRKVFQQWIRLRDKDLPCISCGTTETVKWDAGHYLKAELYTGLIFVEDNCSAQCVQCNSYKGGAEIEYRIGLVKKIGEERVKHLESIKDKNRLYRWSDSELESIKEDYTQRIKELKSKQ